MRGGERERERGEAICILDLEAQRDYLEGARKGIRLIRGINFLHDFIERWIGLDEINKWNKST